VLVTVIGITPLTGLLVSQLAEQSVKDVLDVKDSLTVLNLAAESLLVDLTQDQTNVHRTINAHLLPHMEVNNTVFNVIHLENFCSTTCAIQPAQTLITIIQIQMM
jgi:hypothetical protein